MTKIAHLKPEQEQDGAVGKRTEENLTRVARDCKSRRRRCSRERRGGSAHGRRN